MNSAPNAQLAQLVEQWTENPRVPGSSPGLGNLSSRPSVRRASRWPLWPRRWLITNHLQKLDASRGGAEPVDGPFEMSEPKFLRRRDEGRQMRATGIR